jgi:hypothetical protein
VMILIMGCTSEVGRNIAWAYQCELRVTGCLSGCPAAVGLPPLPDDIDICINRHSPDAHGLEARIAH